MKTQNQNEAGFIQRNISKFIVLIFILQPLMDMLSFFVEKIGGESEVGFICPCDSACYSRNCFFLYMEYKRTIVSSGCVYCFASFLC